MNYPVVIRDLSTDFDLAILRSHFVLNVPALSAEENNLWTQRLRALATDCGCAMGARFCAAYAVSVPFMLWSVLNTFDYPIVLLVILSAVAFVPVAGLGKAVGLVIARVQLFAALNYLRRHYA